jgi:hypothetical protein
MFQVSACSAAVDGNSTWPEITFSQLEAGREHSVTHVDPGFPFILRHFQALPSSLPGNWQLLNWASVHLEAYYICSSWAKFMFMLIKLDSTYDCTWRFSQQWVVLNLLSASTLCSRSTVHIARKNSFLGMAQLSTAREQFNLHFNLWLQSMFGEHVQVDSSQERLGVGCIASVMHNIHLHANSSSLQFPFATSSANDEWNVIFEVSLRPYQDTMFTR